MQTISDIYAAINPLPALLADKGKVQPDARFQIEANAGISISYSWLKSVGGWEKSYAFFSGDTADEALAKAREFITNLPDAETAKLHDFMGQLGKVIDAGNALGIDVNYITETMKRLSENAITHQKKEAA